MAVAGSAVAVGQQGYENTKYSFLLLSGLEENKLWRAKARKSEELGVSPASM